MNILPKIPKTSRLLFIFLAVSLLLLSSCAGPRLTDSWKSNSNPEIKVNDVLVLSLVRHNERRKMLDNALVRVLAREKIEATQSYKIDEDMIEETRDAVVELVKKADSEFIMIVTVGDVRDKTYTQSSSAFSIQGDSPGRDRFYLPSRSSSATVTNTMVNLDVNVYDIKTEKQIWSAGLKTKNPKVTRDYLEKMAIEVVQGMKRDGII